MDERLRKIGVEKVKKFNQDFDLLYDFYKKRALEQGYEGELKFIKTKSRIIIYVII